MIVKVKLGANMYQYTIHQELLAACSKHFRNTLKDPIQESQDSEMTLTDVTKGTFEAFMHWLYSHELPDNLQTSQLFALYAFAAHYQIPNLQKASMDAYLITYTGSDSDYLPTYETVIEAFELFPGTSPICKFFVDIYCERFRSNYDDNKEKQLRSKLPHEFLVNCLLKSSELRSYAVGDGDPCRLDPCRLDPCDYHEHSNTRERVKCELRKEVNELKDGTKRIE